MGTGEGITLRPGVQPAGTSVFRQAGNAAAMATGRYIESAASGKPRWPLAARTRGRPRVILGVRNKELTGGDGHGLSRDDEDRGTQVVGAGCARAGGFVGGLDGTSG